MPDRKTPEQGGYRRVVLKLSGESFGPPGKSGISIDEPIVPTFAMHENVPDTSASARSIQRRERHRQRERPRHRRRARSAD